MNKLILSLGIACAAVTASAQSPVWQPSAGHVQLPIWPGTPPDAQAVPGAESATTRPTSHLVAGRPWTYVSNVARPTMTVYSPTGQNTGAAVVVFPGGGYQILAIDLEGSEVCDWLVARGITCVLLKYRVPNAGPSWSQRCGCDLDTKSSMPLADAQRTIALVRAHAAEWHVDPHKVGVLGFSAGGHLVAATSTHFDRRVYAPVDSADRQSIRPDFAVALYPGHLYDGRTHGLNPEIRVTRNVPPTFILQAENDDVDTVSNSLTYYAALEDAGVSAELHIYPQGGHAFGLRPTKNAITGWPVLVERWLQTIGIVAPVVTTVPNEQAVGDSVLALEQATDVAVDRLDCAGAFANIADEAPLFVGNSRVVRTRAAFLAACDQFTAPRTGAVFVTDTATVHVLSPDAAYVVREGTYTVNYKDGTVRRTYLVMTSVWARRDGAWKMVHLHESSRPFTP